MQYSVAKYRTATKQRLQQDRLILLPLCLSNVFTRIRFCIAPPLSVEILGGTASVEHFIRRIVPSEQKEVPWHLSAIAILTKTQQPKNSLSDQINHSQDKSMDTKSGANLSDAAIVRAARHISLEPRVRHQILTNTTSSELLANGPRSLLTSRQKIFTARGVTDNFPNEPFYIRVRNFSDLELRLQKHIITAHTTEPPSDIHAIEADC